MVRFVIRARHVRQILLGLFPNSCDGWPSPEWFEPYAFSPSSEEEWLTTVYVHFAHLFEALSRRSESTALSEAIRERLEHTARNGYHADFRALPNDALKLLAIHELCRHGEALDLSRGSGDQYRAAWLPDFAIGARVFAHKSVAGTGDIPIDRLVFKVGDQFFVQGVEGNCFDTFAAKPRANTFGNSAALNWEEVHWCDTLRDVWDHVIDVDATSPDVEIVFQAIPSAFCQYQAWRLRRPENVPLVGKHRYYSAAAVRRGLAMPQVARLFPSALWANVEDTTKDVFLDAAEETTRASCPVMLPDTPDRAEAEIVLLKLMHNPTKPIESFEKPEAFRRVLRQLGIEAAVRNEQAECAWDWRFALAEIDAALHDHRIEESIRLKQVLQLYSLHKRVLSLVESTILPKLEKRGLNGHASKLWTNAFLESVTDNTGNVLHKGPLNTHTQKAKLGHLATLETEGNWLLYAAGHQAAGETEPIDLAALLDGIIALMSSAVEVTDVSVSLHPATPQVHARQLATLADCSNYNAACVTLYLGKVALMLRNAVEHGTDRVVRERLVLETPGYWTERGGVLQWLTGKADEVSWRSKSSLPRTLPSAANAFLLTSDSLYRCVVLLTLVMHAGRSQLGI